MSQQKRPFFRQWKDRRNQQWALAVLVLIVLMVSTVLWLRASLPPEEAGGEEHVEAADTHIVTLDVAAQRNIGLKIETAQTKTLVQTIQTTGVVGPNETRVGHIRPLARGRIEKVYVRLGDRVRAGQPLLAYDNIELGELIGDFLKALAVLEQKSTEAEVAKQALERAQNLVELGAVARAEYERRNAEYKNALAAINSQKATIAQVEEKLHRFGLTDADVAHVANLRHADYHREASHSVLRAPFDGVVIKYDVAEGEVVNTDRELLTIADLSTVWVQADVYEKDIASVHKGQDVKIVMDAYPGETFIGTITYVSDVLDPKTRTAKVRCEVRNLQARLKLDMFATIHIPTPIGREAVMIPTSAVQQIDNQSVVFVRLNDTQFQRREVQLGAQSDGWVEVKSGVKAGEAVVTQGSFYVKSALLREQIGGEEGH
ncbi:MAG: efflux RND transporter periplasmic adaptor subunit [Acidobacteriota bacterium]|nr:efflux RND transporter periplasmic adaptor subunit [Blastocatellia bacterium]MDW8239753.1 efflux RND transporter periplasmic adaptor subunit [Acidobacteriota bacterium]